MIPALYRKLPETAKSIIIALLLSAATFGIRWLLDPLLLNRQPYTPAFAAVAIAAWFGNWRAGALTAVTSHLLANYFFTAPRGRFSIDETELAGAGSFYLIAAVVIYLSHTATTANRRLSEAVTTLRQADARKTNFLAVLSHELRNPLAALRNSLYLLSYPSPEHVVREARDVMDRQLTHMTHLVADLMDVARIDQGKIELRRETVPLAQLINDASSAIRPILADMRQPLTVDVPALAGELSVDPVRISQVLTNLLHNASKYSPKGAPIHISVEQQTGVARIAIRDSGIGIPQAKLNSIFESFVQLAPGAADRSGLGLGLTLVRQLVELHGGSVEAYSEGIGLGSTFTVVLPMVTGAATDTSAAAGSESAGLAGRSAPLRQLRVLIVDDNEDAAQILALLLEAKGHQATVTFNGEAALDALQQLNPHLVLLDIGLPGMSGHEVARRICAQMQSPAPYLVAVTGWGKHEDIEQSRAVGCDMHLTKPVSQNELNLAIEKAAQLAEDLTVRREGDAPTA